MRTERASRIKPRSWLRSAAISAHTTSDSVSRVAAEVERQVVGVRVSGRGESACVNEGVRVPRIPTNVSRAASERPPPSRTRTASVPTPRADTGSATGVVTPSRGPASPYITVTSGARASGRSRCVHRTAVTPPTLVTATRPAIRRPRLRVMRSRSARLLGTTANAATRLRVHGHVGWSLHDPFGCIAQATVGIRTVKRLPCPGSLVTSI